MLDLWTSTTWLIVSKHDYHVLLDVWTTLSIWSPSDHQLLDLRTTATLANGLKSHHPGICKPAQAAHKHILPVGSGFPWYYWHQFWITCSSVMKQSREAIMLEHNIDWACEQLSDLASCNGLWPEGRRHCYGHTILADWWPTVLATAWCRASCGGPNVFWHSDSAIKAMLTYMCASELLVVVQKMCRNMHQLATSMKEYARRCIL